MNLLSSISWVFLFFAATLSYSEAFSCKNVEVEQAHRLTSPSKSIFNRAIGSDRRARQRFACDSLASVAPLAFVLAIGLPSSALAADEAASFDISRGATLFTSNCAGCHAGGMNYVKEQKTLKKESLQKFISADFDQSTIKSWLQSSGQHSRIVFFKMPDGKMKDGDWGDVAGYVVDQALNDKW